MQVITKYKSILLRNMVVWLLTTRMSVLEQTFIALGMISDCTMLTMRSFKFTQF